MLDRPRRPGPPLAGGAAPGPPGRARARRPGQWCYARLLGRRFADTGCATAATVAGCGAHLAATVRRDILEVPSSAPAGFEDVVGLVSDGGRQDPLGRHVVIAVADPEESAATAERLGGEALARFDADRTHQIVVRDPRGRS